MSRFAPQKKICASEMLLTQAINDKKETLSSSELQLIASGYQALKEREAEPLNRIELTAMRSMIAYVAVTQKVEEKKVVSILKATYDIEEVEEMANADYQRAIDFLIDLDITKTIN